MGFEKPVPKKRGVPGIRAAIAATAAMTAVQANAVDQMPRDAIPSAHIEEPVHAAKRHPEVSGWSATVERAIAPDDSPEKRQRYIENASAAHLKFLAENKGAIEIGDHEKAFELALQQQPHIDPALFRGTKYDIEHLKKHIFMFVVRLDERSEKKVHIVPPYSDTNIADRLFVGLDLKSGYGNVIFTGPRTMLLAGHVAGMIAADSNAWEQLPSDVVFADVPPTFEVPPQYIVDTKQMPPSQDIHGKLMVILGADPDAESDSQGIKTFAGFAQKPTPALMMAIGEMDTTPTFIRFDSQSVFMPLPPDTAIERDDMITGRGKSRPISGVSGGLAFVFDEEAMEWKFAGNLWGSSLRDREADRYAVGSVNAPDTIRRAYTNEMQRITIPPTLFSPIRDRGSY